MKDYEWAKDKIIMGPERRSSYIPPDSKKLTAYHEVSDLLPELSLALYIDRTYRLVTPWSHFGRRAQCRCIKLPACLEGTPSG
jgi:hypothetical protein